jgi:hypothetical protein
MAAEAFINPLLVPYIVTFSLSMDFESGFFSYSLVPCGNGKHLIIFLENLYG